MNDFQSIAIFVLLGFLLVLMIIIMQLRNDLKEERKTSRDWERDAHALAKENERLRDCLAKMR